MLHKLIGTLLKNGSLDSVYKRMAWRRTTDAIVLNTPILNMPTRAAFSRVGRWTLRRVVMGRIRIHISIAMLIELVAV